MTQQLASRRTSGPRESKGKVLMCLTTVFISLSCRNEVPQIGHDWFIAPEFLQTPEGTDSNPARTLFLT